MATVSNFSKKTQAPEGSNKNQKLFIIAFCVTAVVFWIWGVDHRAAVTEENVRSVDFAMKAHSGGKAPAVTGPLKTTVEIKPAQSDSVSTFEVRRDSPAQDLPTARPREEHAIVYANPALLETQNFVQPGETTLSSRTAPTAPVSLKPVDEPLQLANAAMQSVAFPPARSLQSIFEESQRAERTEEAVERPIAKPDIIAVAPARKSAFNPPRTLQSLFEESQKSKVETTASIETSKVETEAKISAPIKSAYPPPRSLQSLFEESQKSEVGPASVETRKTAKTHATPKRTYKCKPLPDEDLPHLAARKLGDAELWPQVWADNPQIKNPYQLEPNENVELKHYER